MNNFFIIGLFLLHQKFKAKSKHYLKMNLTPGELCEIQENQDIQLLQRYGGISSIADRLDTDLKNGIRDSKSIQSRIITFGSNNIPDIEVKSFFEMLKEALMDETLLILITCAILSLVLEMLFSAPEDRSTAWIDGAAILAAVAIVSLVQATSNHKQELQFAAVNRIKSIYNVAVVRNGRISQIKNIDIVVGDVILLEQGNRIPADSLCIESQSVKVDQSTATGESEAVIKGAADPFFISNTHVTEGRATMLVTCVGIRSHHGKIFELIANEERTDTPLQEKLSDLAKKIGYFGIIVAAITFVILCIGWGYHYFTIGWKWSALREPLNYFIVAITIVACAVPEGLPLAVTISLAYSMRQMMNDNNFVRHLSACETMGSATVICSDKTGTLTKNEMNVERFVVGLEADKKLTNPTFINMLKRSMAVNSHAIIAGSDEIGSQTECALVRYIGQQHTEKMRESADIINCFQFDRTRKRMSTVEKINENGNFIVHVKGAPDEMIPTLSHYMLENGEIHEITEDFKNQLNTLINEECAKSYRTLAVAYKSTNTIPSLVIEAESDLTLLAILSIRDSLRRHTVKSIAECQHASIRVVMVTGDHMLTATSIAKECGIMKSDGVAITGQQLRTMTDEELHDVLPHICVVARSTPADKHMLVQAFQNDGQVVAVTGDGTNDVAALIKADVGLAMGKCGTELAKEASDIVVLDDDFRSIVKSVVWGRCVYNNIQRFLQFQLTANVATLFISLVSAVFLKDTPFQAVQLLWVNLIMDSLGALSLATGKPHDSLLDKKPQHKDAPLITPFMIVNIIGQAFLQSLLICVILLFPNNYEPYSQRHYTFLFNVFVLCQMFNLLNARSTCPTESVIVGLLDTPLFLGIMIGIGVVQAILVQLAGDFFSCTPLNFKEWGISLALSGLSLPVGVILRKIAPLLSTGKLFKNSEADREDNQPLLL
ncbi:calcium-translocating P-type ATPase, PMCA-type family protein [Tritrichomonas foetus]|uniref:Calcium-transporting ATPase n=1 Tax=Tritrichomonas foetus TaxID=1144522 RepID=A0A1J4KHQ8_9EUKA|nr:calcium-translocating P-type ATPase, PMCA-type family protein [Tritrichomonas foetus]|eukprot:OHT10921.1 calcium-translocating P-type ATPase, PMCA-type family protein [Tritrichomonas foetus]